MIKILMMKFIITEEEKKSIINLHGLQSNISEQFEILSINPANLIFRNDPTNSKTILLSGKVGNKTQTLRYNISGRYGNVGSFPLILRNIRRDNTTKDLLGEATPNYEELNWIKSTALKGAFKLIPSKSKTKDGWLMIRIPVKKLNEALSELNKNKGTTASIDAGSGVYVDLRLVGSQTA